MSDKLSPKQRAFMAILQTQWPQWTSAVQLSRVSLAYTRVIHELRAKTILIANRVEIQPVGSRHGYYRLGPAPTPRSSVLRALKTEAPQQNLIDRPEELFDAAGRYPD